MSCPACGAPLTGASAHKRAHKVLDIDRCDLMVTETLGCTVCSVNYLETSHKPRFNKQYGSVRFGMVRRFSVSIVRSCE